MRFCSDAAYNLRPDVHMQYKSFSLNLKGLMGTPATSRRGTNNVSANFQMLHLDAGEYYGQTSVLMIAPKFVYLDKPM